MKWQVFLGTCFALLSLLVAGQLANVSPFLANVFVAVTVLCILGTAALWIRWRSRDRYDLGLLREIDERAKLDEIEVGKPTDGEAVLCLGCQTLYDARLPACPHCGRAF